MQYQAWKTKAVLDLQKSAAYREEAFFWLSSIVDTLAEGLLFNELGPDQKRRLLSGDLESVQLERLAEGLVRLCSGEPVERIIGFVYFMDSRINLGPKVLAPRVDTEVLVETAMDSLGDLVRSKLHILDLCTGSGCVAIALAKALQIAGAGALTITATDIAEEAVRCAEKNIVINGLETLINVEQADLWPSTAVKASAIVSNPPYLATEELNPELLDYDPRLALEGGPDGLELYRRIFTEAPQYLQRQALLIVEHGQNQAEALRELALQNAVWSFVETRRDMGKRPRVSVFRYLE